MCTEREGLVSIESERIHLYFDLCSRHLSTSRTTNQEEADEYQETQDRINPGRRLRLHPHVRNIREHAALPTRFSTPRQLTSCHSSLYDHVYPWITDSHHEENR